MKILATSVAAVFTASSLILSTQPAVGAENESRASVSPTPSSRLTTAARAEIRRVVREGRAPAAQSARQAGRADLLAARVADELRCAEFEGLRYCLHYGWTEATEAETVAEYSALGTADQVAAGTGDLPLSLALAAHSALPAGTQAALERSELTAAAEAVAKVWMIKHEIEGVPLPADFHENHPEAQALTTYGSRAAASSRAMLIPGDPVATTKILDTNKVSEQTRTYWCGPASMQMIDWNWDGGKETQEYWDGALGTTTDGTAITAMVREVNQQTGWDNAAYAGTYVVLNIDNYNYGEWYDLLVRHIFSYEAPLVLHPLLHKTWFPYLDDDGSGHFQVGRGYDNNGSDPNLIGYFEPWNQQRFNPSEPFIARVQWRQAENSFSANQAHFQHNIGV